MRIFRSLAAFFGTIYEKMFAHYFKTFSLGLRRRAVAVSAASTIVANPFLLFTVIFLFAGGVIGIMGRILSRN